MTGIATAITEIFLYGLLPIALIGYAVVNFVYIKHIFEELNNKK